MTFNYRIALAGNPNTGKTTLFNALTGMNQHTGNWAGKTVESATGTFTHAQKIFEIIDLPGTYSLFPNSADEEVARDYLLKEKPDLTLVVVDATSLQRNFTLALQVMEVMPNVIICLNLIDEAKKKGIRINTQQLISRLGVPVIEISARNRTGFPLLLDTIERMATKKIEGNPVTQRYSDELEEKLADIEQLFSKEIGEKLSTRWMALRLLDGDETFVQSLLGTFEVHTNLEEANKKAKELTTTDMRDSIILGLMKQTQQILAGSVTFPSTSGDQQTEKLDAIFTSKWLGFPIMLGMLGVIFYLTIAGANVPSSMLASFFGTLEKSLTALFVSLHSPQWLHGLLVLGLYRGVTWVISVMLPPMAIFFPAFALLENYGYLPRIAFNMDRIFKRVGAHGKQSLTMAMGFGCNAAAVMSSRIIESPRERMLAILTNNFVPCNGRWGTLIVLSSLFMAASFSKGMKTFVTTGVVVGLVLVGILVTFFVSWLLSKTLLKGMPTHYTLELPPYRRPKIGETIFRSSLTKSWSVLVRAVKVAAPAALLTWVAANVYIGDTSILLWVVHWLDPFARLLGLDGYILMAFLLGLPANEIVFPILLMGYLSTGSLTEVNDMDALKEILLAHGWTWLTALNMMLFSLLHYPCGTTLLNIYKETKSKKWTILAFAIPTFFAIIVPFFLTQIAHWLHWV